MREKNKIKIVLSLLIAVAFLLPSASVLAGSPTSTETVKASTPTKQVIKLGTDNAQMIQMNVPTNDPSPLDDEGCFPVDVTALSVNGHTLVDNAIYATGTYPLDMTVCKTQWDPACMGVETLMIVDQLQEYTDPAYTRILTPLYVYATCFADHVVIRFYLPAGVNGWAEPLGDAGIQITGDITASLTAPIADPTHLYNGATVITGATVVRNGGWPALGGTNITITIPRDGVNWATCCQHIQWYYSVYSSLGPLNGNVGGPLRDVCSGDFYPATVKKFVEIHKQRWIPENATTNKTVNIYCENFENPCEIMLNWSTIDMPVWGANGALDTWTWSDKRYCSAGHSMHSTSFDTYLPDQNDILQLNFGGHGLNVSGYCQICVSWCQWIQGDAFNIGNATVPIWVIQDYGYFQYSFDGINYIPVNAVKYYSSDGKTETITVCIDNRNNMGPNGKLFFQWVWKSDPKFCYEGWYIDDVCIVGTICGQVITPGSYTWDFVMDSYSYPQTFDGQCETYIFNESWIATPGTYRICGWLETLDDCHYSSTPYTNRFCKIVKIGDITDVALNCQNVQITPSPPVEAGTDVTITATVCNNGTLPATNVQVNAKVGRGFYFGGYSTGFEGAVNQPTGILQRWQNPGNQFPNEWVTNWNALYRSEAHYTHYGLGTANGNTAIANFNHLEGAAPHPWLHSIIGANDYLRGPFMFVLGHLGANLKVNFDAKFNYGVGEEFRAGLWDWDLGTGYFYNGQKGPYFADWASYTYDLTPLFSSLLTAGAAPTDNFCIGFYFLKAAPADGAPLCPWQNDWRGYMLDNIVVPPAIPTGEVVLDQTQIIPKLNVSTCVPLTWHWNDTIVGDYYFCVEILNQDADLTNNKCCKQYVVYNYQECPNFYCVDYSGQGPGHWVTDGCCGGVIWDGNMATTTYGNLYDDVLYLKNATGGLNFNVPGGAMNVQFDTWFQMNNQDFGYFEYSTDGLHWTKTTYYGNSTAIIWGADAYGWTHRTITFTGTATTQMRFHFISNDTGVQRGWLLDNIVVKNGATTIFSSDGTSLTPFYAHETQYGCWWYTPNVFQHFLWDLPGNWVALACDAFATAHGYTTGHWDLGWGVYDPSANAVKENPAYYGYMGVYPDNLNCAIRWDIKSQGLYKGWLTTEVYYDTQADTIMHNDSYARTYNDTGFIEAKGSSATTWTELANFNGSANDDNAWGDPVYYLGLYDYEEYTSGQYLALDAFMAGTDTASLQFRFISDGSNPHGYAGYGFSYMTCLLGMKDVNPPKTTASMTGTFDQQCHWYTSAVTITLTATDDLTGVCKTYYTLDGIQHEYIMPVVINTDGTHTFCFWSVDCEGNTEAKQCLPDFRIDLTGPTVSITGPATGYLYLFGNQLFALKSGKTIFLFNGIAVTATASATDAAVKVVQFYLDDVLMNEDTTAPYSAKLSTKHSGPATIKVTAIDVLGRSASATLNIDNYLKLF
ncbi:Uncharacterised protein [uncultured archaeon]|nr:Uncharacterised protein [uncultured archaeon]